MLAAYWHRDGIEVFEVKDRKIRKIASGSLDAIKPLDGPGSWGRKVLIAARGLSLCTRKRFPPTTEENIAGAVRMEIGELFPFEKPAFSMNIFERTANYCLVDIWAWDSSAYEKIEKIFPFTHVIPEELVFQSAEAEIRVYEHDGLQHLVAHDRDGFIGGISLRTVTRRDLELFVRGLGNRADEIKRIIVSGGKMPALAGSAIPVVAEPVKEYPWCMQYVYGRDLRKFRSGRELLPLRGGLLFIGRIVLYFLVIYTASLFVSWENYDRAIEGLSARINALNIGPASKTLNTGEDTSGIIDELRETRKSRIQPLALMDILAQSMPQGAYLWRISCNESGVELSAAGPDPLDVFEAISKARCVKTARLKGSPSKDQGGLYNLTVVLEMNQCE